MQVLSRYYIDFTQVALLLLAPIALVLLSVWMYRRKIVAAPEEIKKL
jgi:hypothetical protein